jgi:DNA-binding transcriptional regulator YbjK
MSNIDEAIKRALEPFIADYRKHLAQWKTAGSKDSELAQMKTDALLRAAATFPDNPEILAWLTEQFREAGGDLKKRPQE